MLCMIQGANAVEQILSFRDTFHAISMKAIRLLQQQQRVHRTKFSIWIRMAIGHWLTQALFYSRKMAASYDLSTKNEKGRVVREQKKIKRQ